MDMKPVPTIFSDSILLTATKQRKPPTIRVLQEDELEKFQNNDKIDQFDQLDDSPHRPGTRIFIHEEGGSRLVL